MPVKVYFKGGKGIISPVDVDGNEIKEGAILTHCYFNEDYPKFFKDYYPSLSDEKIHEVSHEPAYEVKRDEKGFLYGEGIKKELYLHDFCFKHCKVVRDKEQ